MIYFGFTWRLKREENINSEIMAPTEIYIGSSGFGINWLDFNWGRCGGMMGDFVIGEVLLFYYWNLVTLFQ